MGLPNVFQTGRTGLMATKAGIATAGHNIANANSEGFSRQRVHTEAEIPRTTAGTHALIGTGTKASRVERINDEYVEKQIRNSAKDLSHMEEKDLVLRQAEDIFNEMNGDGLNRLISRFFNEFRKLSTDPDNEALRQSVREATQAVVNDFRRLRKEVDSVRQHIDARVEGYSREVNSLSEELRDLNIRIKDAKTQGVTPNDLLDKRDVVLKKLASYMDTTMHQDKEGSYIVDAKGVGQLVVGTEVAKFSVFRSPADAEGKPENALDLQTSSSANPVVTHRLKGGKIGALLETRDKTLSTVLERLDDLAYTMTESINDIHVQGFTRMGVQGINFFKPLLQKERAAEFMALSDQVEANVNNIATASIPDAPGDNRIAIAISGIQGEKLMNGGKATMDEWYNSIVSDVGVVGARNRAGINQQKDIMNQLEKIRNQISGVSIDEETTNLMQFQQAFGANAKVIQVADEMLKTVLDLKR